MERNQCRAGEYCQNPGLPSCGGCPFFQPADVKDTSNKLEFTPFSWEAMEELAKIFREAKNKYGTTDSWRESGVEGIPKYMNALQRHLIELLKGKPDVYTEDYKGKSYTWRHSAQLMWNAMAICHKMLQKEGKI